MNSVIHLFSGSVSPTPLPLPLDLPSTIAGQPARYLWKDVIRIGRYVHPRQRFALSVDRDRMDRWVRAFRNMSTNGVRVTVPVDHSDRAADNRGYVIDLRRVGDTLFALHQLIGNDAQAYPARNGVSLGIDPDFIDGHGRRYGEAIVHSSLTPVPVVPGQGDWSPLMLSNPGSRAAADTLPLYWSAAQERQSTMDMNSEQLAAAQRILPDGETLTPDNFVERVIEYLRQSVSALLSRSDIPKAPSNEAASALVVAAKAKRDMAVARGALTPAVADKLFARLVKTSDGRLNTIALSRVDEGGGSGGCLALAVFDDLAENRPVVVGESSGIQTLSRVVPDGENAAVNPKLQERMIALANGKA